MDYARFRSWRCIVPDEKEKELLTNLGDIQSPIVPYLEKVVRNFRASKFGESATFCRKAFSVAETKEDRVILQYVLSMVLLESR